MFAEFSLKDLIDILLVASFLYYAYRLMKASSSINLFSGVLIFILIWVIVSQVLEMRLLGSILDKLVSVGVIAFIVIFQDEVRHFLISLGNNSQTGFFARFFLGKKKEMTSRNDIMPIVLACLSMSKKNVGALIAVKRDFNLAEIIQTGEVIDAQINQRLIENIFFKNSPLHDGAMVIADKRIKAAGCILPVSHSFDIPKDLGLRHRAALGLSQESDALVIIVSEETGNISIAQRGVFRLRLTAEELERLLTKED